MPMMESGNYSRASQSHSACAVVKSPGLPKMQASCRQVGAGCEAGLVVRRVVRMSPPILFPADFKLSLERARTQYDITVQTAETLPRVPAIFTTRCFDSHLGCH